MNEKSKIAVLGGGSWATAIAKIALVNAHEINWYMRRQDQIDEFLRLSKIDKSDTILFAVFSSFTS